MKYVYLFLLALLVHPLLSALSVICANVKEPATCSNFDFDKSIRIHSLLVAMAMTLHIYVSISSISICLYILCFYLGEMFYDVFFYHACNSAYYPKVICKLFYIMFAVNEFHVQQLCA